MKRLIGKNKKETGANLQEERLQVNCEEYWYLGDPYVRVHLAVPANRWPDIKKSAEWRAFYDLLNEDQEKKNGMETEENMLQSIRCTLEHIDQLLTDQAKTTEISINIPDRDHQSPECVLIRKPYTSEYVLAGTTGKTKYSRFELLTGNDEEKKRLERVIEGRGLSRQDIATILFSLRVRPGFGKEDFGI